MMRCFSLSERSAVLQLADGKTTHTEAHRNLQAVRPFDWLCLYVQQVFLSDKVTGRLHRLLCPTLTARHALPCRNVITR